MKFSPANISRKKLFRLILYALSGAVAFMALLFILVYAGLFGSLASVEELKSIQNHISSEIYSNEKVLLGKYYYQDRTNVRYSDLPGHLIYALVATEDARFYEHHGIDRRSAFRVVFKSILLRDKSAGGGSTIHQQLIKNLYPRRSYSILSIPVNKFREMIMGVRLDKAYSKEEILELYLNTVSFGENTYGIETAAQRFFNKSPEKLSIEESALLVGMLKGTYIYNPRYFPEKSIERRNLVLDLMVNQSYLDSLERDSLIELPLRLNYYKLTHNEGLAPYFREHLRQVLTAWTENNPRSDGSKYNIYTDGLKIYTTINADLQKYAETAVASRMSQLQKAFDQQWKNRNPWRNNSEYINRKLENSKAYQHLKSKGTAKEEIMKVMHTPRKMEVFTWQGMKEVELSPYDSILHYEKFLHAGLLSMEASTGYVRAWVGGINSRYFKYDHVKSRRQVGSTFKPLLYAAALSNGHDPCSYLANDSVVYEEYDDWTPSNTGLGYGGYYSMKGALTHSVNTVSVKLLEETGINEVRDFAESLGLEGDLPEVLSLALGSGTASLLEMVQAYSIFPNKGSMIRPVILQRIEDKFGNVIYEYEGQEAEQRLDPYNAELMIEMMKSVVDSGTASSLRTAYRFDSELAGKTGTTQENTDGWFIGFNPVLITGVWVGGDLPVIRFRYGGYGQGAASALPIWARYMQKIYGDPTYRNSRDLSFEIPDEVKSELDCEDYLESTEEYKWEERKRWIRDFFNRDRRRRR